MECRKSKAFEPSTSRLRWQELGWILLLVLAVLAFFWRWWLDTPKLWEDAILYGWPSASILAEHLAKFKLALWDPYSYGGVSWLGPPIYGNFYFGQIWLVVAVWLTGSPLGQFSYATWLAAHYVAAAIGMWMLVRKLKFEAPFAFIGAIAYALSFIIIFRFRHTCYLIPIAWLPLCCFLTVRFLEKPTWRRSAILGLFSGSVFLGGAPQYNFFITLVLLVIVLLFPKDESINRKSLYLKLCVGFLIAIGINSISLLYQFQYATFCGRINSGFELTAPQASPWWRISGLFFPYVTGYFYPPSYIKLEWGDDRLFSFMHICEESIFPGMTILLGLCLYCVTGAWKNRMTWPWLGLLIIGAILSLGEFNPIQAFVRFVVYPLATARVPMRIWCIAHLGLIFLSLYGYQHFFSLNRGRAITCKAAIILIGFYLLAIGITFWRFDQIPPVDANKERAQHVIFITILAQIALIVSLVEILNLHSYLRKKIARPFQIALAVILYGELLILVSPMTQGPADDWRVYATGPNDIALFEGLRNEHRRMDALPFMETNQRAARARAPSLQGYSTMQLPFTGNTFVRDSDPNSSENARRLDLYGVRVVANKKNNELSLDFRKNPFPKAWFCEKAEYVSLEETLERIDTANLDLKHTVLLEPKANSIESWRDGEQAKRRNLDSKKEGVVEVISYEDDEVTVRVKSSQDGWVVINDHFAPGWNCTVDGVMAEILRANYLFRATPISAGQHIIRYWFWPRSLTLGLIIGAISISLAGILIIIPINRERSLLN
jgi:hypothetical protein